VQQKQDTATTGYSADESAGLLYSSGMESSFAQSDISESVAAAEDDSPMAPRSMNSTLQRSGGQESDVEIV